MRKLVYIVSVLGLLFTLVGCNVLGTNNTQQKELEYLHKMLKYLSDTYPDEHWTMADGYYSGIKINYSGGIQGLGLGASAVSASGYFECSTSRPVFVTYYFESEKFDDTYFDCKYFDQLCEDTTNQLKSLLGDTEFFLTEDYQELTDWKDSKSSYYLKSNSINVSDFTYDDYVKYNSRSTWVIAFGFDINKTKDLIDNLMTNYKGFNNLTFRLYLDGIADIKDVPFIPETDGGTMQMKQHTYENYCARAEDRNTDCIEFTLERTFDSEVYKLSFTAFSKFAEKYSVYEYVDVTSIPDAFITTVPTSTPTSDEEISSVTSSDMSLFDDDALWDGVDTFEPITAEPK